MRLTKTQDFTNGLRGYSLRSPGADNSAEPAVVTWVRPSQAAIRSFAPLACISGWTGSGVRPLPPIDPLSFALAALENSDSRDSRNSRSSCDSRDRHRSVFLFRLCFPALANGRGLGSRDTKWEQESPEMSCGIDRVVSTDNLVVLFIGAGLRVNISTYFGAYWNRNRADLSWISQTFSLSTEKP